MKETTEQMKARIRASISKDNQARMFGFYLAQGENGYKRDEKVYPRA